ncbi:INPP5J family protein [Megaselia abdita]
MVSTSLILHQLCVYIVTWNVGTKYPDDISLHSLLGLNKNPSLSEYLPDIYAIGLQEVNSQPQNQLLGFFKEDQWIQKFKDVLQGLDYVSVKTEQMQGLLLTVFVRKQHLVHLRNIESEYTRTGLGNLWGNKGAVSVRMQLYGVATTFVAAHLAAHDHELDERIEDYKQIINNHHYHVKKYKNIFDHDYVFWFGDLNFRLSGDDSPEQVRSLVEKNNLKELLERDQLFSVRRENKAFQYLEERLPEFPPTFKFKEGTSQYDMKRRPAWTDRILYAVQKDNYANVTLNLNQKSYKCHPGYNISDHKPVTSEFLMAVQDIPVTEGDNIEFTFISRWVIDEENIIEYWQSKDFRPASSDWIGIYKQSFASLSEYIAYEYVNQAECYPVEDSENLTHCSLRAEFPENVHLNDGESYILIYIKNTGIRGVMSICGISNVFRGENRPPSPRFEAVD